MIPCLPQQCKSNVVDPKQKLVEKILAQEIHRSDYHWINDSVVEIRIDDSIIQLKIEKIYI